MGWPYPCFRAGPSDEADVRISADTAMITQSNCAVMGARTYLHTYLAHTYTKAVTLRA